MDEHNGLVGYIGGDSLTTVLTERGDDDDNRYRIVGNVGYVGYDLNPDLR